MVSWVGRLSRFFFVWGPDIYGLMCGVITYLFILFAFIKVPLAPFLKGLFTGLFFISAGIPFISGLSSWGRALYTLYALLTSIYPFWYAAKALGVWGVRT